MAHRCMPTALVILALSLTGCLGAAPTTHSSDVATVISSSFRGDATFDVLTGTYFPPQHGNFTRATARQTLFCFFSCLDLYLGYCVLL